LTLLPHGAAFAATKGADLRVVNTAGSTLAQFRQYTGTVRIKSDPQADCFGPPGGSGDTATVRGATGLGIVKDGLTWDRRLRPLSVTDQFSFGLAVCGIGGYEAQGSSFWYLKDNHAGSQVGGDQVKLHDGDDILWYLTPSFPPPPELVLRAPAQAQPGVPFQVRANQYLDDGTKAPAEGATVSGGTAPATTGPEGTAMVTVASPGSARLQATRESDGAIPSNLVKVCVNSYPSRCPDAHGDRVFGSGAADEIRGTRGWDTIQAGGGGDVIDLRGGGRDRVGCGPGSDHVILSAGDGDDRIAPSCERVVRR
jgi:hypothetical protein